MIAGPNGAGKTTFALYWLPQAVGRCRFVNADLIAAGLSPLSPERAQIQASRLFLHEIEACIAAEEDFAFETTLAGRSYLRLVRRLRALGWRVELIYLALPSVELSRLRVAERVAAGGHDVPTAELVRRFPRSLRNLLTDFAGAVSRCRCMMHEQDRPLLVFSQQAGEEHCIVDVGRYARLQELAEDAD